MKILLGTTLYIQMEPRGHKLSINVSDKFTEGEVTPPFYNQKNTTKGPISPIRC